jgi:hypothetical protein
MPQQIQLRRGAAASWTSANPVLAQGEPGVETDTGKFKIGDGSTAWASLAYATATGVLLAANNLSDLASASTARTNLGLGTAATQASTAFDAAGAATTAQAASLQKTSNLSDLASATTARTNLGLGTAATLASSAVALTANNLSDVASATTARSNLGAAQALARAAVKTSAYTAAAGDLVPVDTTSGAVTITLPTGVPDKSRVTVKHIIQGGTNAVTVACSGSDTYNRTGGATTTTLPLLAQGVTVEYNSAGGIWTILNGDLPLSQLDLRYDVTGAATTAQAASLQKTSNLSDLASATTARTNLGLAAVAASGSATDLTTGSVPAGRFGATTVPVSAVNATGTPSSTTYLRGDGAWSTPAAGTSGPPMKVSTGWKSNSQQLSANWSTTHTLNTLYLVPLMLWASETWDRVGLNCATAVASSVVRAGVYADNGNGYPGTLIADFGTMDCSTTGDKTITISQAMSAGLVWFGAVVQGASGISISNIASYQPPYMPHWVGSTVPFGFGVTFAFTQTSVTGALPGTFTTTVTPTGGTVPRLWARTA